MLNSIRSEASGVFCFLLLLVGLVTLAGCEPPAPVILGAGVDEAGDQAIVGAALANELIGLVPSDDAKIIGAVRPQTGPTGSVFGLGMDDGTRAFALGIEAADGSVELTGAVLEDASGNLIMLQENRENGMKITQATGDAVDLERSGDILQITVTLNASIPPSTLVIQIGADGEATLLEAASTLHATENPLYNVDRFSLSRETQSMKLRPRLQTTVSEDCPAVHAASVIIENACLVWSLITTGTSDDAIERSCLLQQVFLDELRGSTPIPGLGAETEFAPKWIAGAKMGASLGCELVKNGIKVGSAIAHPTIPDLVCLVYGLVDDVSRVVTEDARNLPQVICDSLTDPEVGIGCSNTCVAANNGRCDDGGPLSVSAICLPATDCNDCWTRDVPGCSNTCETARNDICEDTTTCALGTDCHDCGAARPVAGCSDSCDTAQDGECDDAGLGSLTGGCEFGTDCTDCGPRDPEDEPEEQTEDCFDEGICNVNCPNSTPDVDCTNEQLCLAKGLCCVGDGTCDIQSCTGRDPDCTNLDFCSRGRGCCDDDDVCQTETDGEPCPTPDADCAFCENEDDLCIEDCDPPDPDCDSVDGSGGGGGGGDSGCCYDGEFVCFGPMTADECTTDGGTPTAECVGDPCNFACCLPDGTCDETVHVIRCEFIGGIANDFGTTCATTTCTPMTVTTDPVVSTFDFNHDGWFVGPRSDTFGDIVGGGTPNYRPSGGNPGGYISWDDLGDGTHWFFGASSKFRGDMSWAYGKKLTFDLRQFSNNPDSPTANPFVVLNGQSKTVFIRVFENPGSTWTSYSLRLDTTEGWRIGLFSSTEATEAEIREVLSDLDLRIRGEYGVGADTGDLDNVVFGGD